MDDYTDRESNRLAGIMYDDPHSAAAEMRDQLQQLDPQSATDLIYKTKNSEYAGGLGDLQILVEFDQYGRDSGFRNVTMATPDGIEQIAELQAQPPAYYSYYSREGNYSYSPLSFVAGVIVGDLLWQQRRGMDFDDDRYRGWCNRQMGRENYWNDNRDNFVRNWQDRDFRNRYQQMPDWQQSAFTVNNTYINNTRINTTVINNHIDFNVVNNTINNSHRFDHNSNNNRRFDNTNFNNPANHSRPDWNRQPGNVPGNQWGGRNERPSAQPQMPQINERPHPLNPGQLVNPNGNQFPRIPQPGGIQRPPQIVEPAPHVDFRQQHQQDVSREQAIRAQQQEFAREQALRQQQQHQQDSAREQNMRQQQQKPHPDFAREQAIRAQQAQELAREQALRAQQQQQQQHEIRQAAPPAPGPQAPHKFKQPWEK